MTDEEIKQHNAEQEAKYGYNRYLTTIPPILADMARGHGFSLDGYFIGRRWQPAIYANGDASA